MLPRNIFFVHEKIERAIRMGCKQNARIAATTVVDEWAAEVVAAHISTSRFPLQARAEFQVAASANYFGILGMARHQPPETSKWISECNFLMRDRLRFWADKSQRFKACYGARPIRSSVR